MSDIADIADIADLVAELCDSIVDVKSRGVAPRPGTGGWAGAPTTLYPAVPCRIVPASAREVAAYQGRGVRVTHMVYFAQAMALDNSHLIAYADPVSGKARTFAVHGTVNPDEMGAYWKVACEEPVT